MACGAQIRTPSQKTLMVFAFGLAASKLTRKATTEFARNCLATFFLVFSCCRKPSESMLTLPSLLSPMSSEVSPCERPSFTMCRGIGMRPAAPWGSWRLCSSKMFTSNMYLPEVKPTVVRAPPSRYEKPPPVRLEMIWQPLEVNTFMVESALLNSTEPAETLARVSAMASSSSSLGFSGSLGLAGSSAAASSSAFPSTFSSATSAGVSSSTIFISTSATVSSAMPAPTL
mmetsp:Transcript_25335/g.64573  ORF Transcript_25335/g.64573 Transcript_25335/m.64573 type:complete len:229 (-) Transcript_25335:64-750(-)